MPAPAALFVGGQICAYSGRSTFCSGLRADTLLGQKLVEFLLTDAAGSDQLELSM